MNTLQIVIPMAGRGSRFANAGYTTPKPLIPVGGRPMIQWVIDNIRPHRPHHFIFLCLAEHLETYPEVPAELRCLCPGCDIIPVPGVTEGAACTVLLARKFIDSEDPLMIANSDQIVDLNINDYLAAADLPDVSGLIMTFWSDHPKWSFCRMRPDGTVSEVVEKQVVSDEATVGIYNFRRGKDFVRAADTMIAKNLRVNGEFYVAPCYNQLINEGAKVIVAKTGREREGMYGLGIPEDLEFFKTTKYFTTRAADAVSKGNKVSKLIRLVQSSNPRDKIYLERRLKAVPAVGRTLKWARQLRAQLTQRSPEDYVRMQKAAFERYAAADQVEPGNIKGDYVVGSWRQHDEWLDYNDYLMRYVPRDESWLALDFGCGPGRNIRRWNSIFRRIDGVDISSGNLENAKKFLSDSVPKEKTPRLFLTGGMDCGDAPKASYDFVFSTICLQHICVYDVRFSILRSLFECLKPGGRLAIQMGYGVPSPDTVGYYENFVQAIATNRDCDVAVSSPQEIKDDLLKIGFVDFESWVRPVGPGDVHPNWIFVAAVKPKV